MRFKLVSNGMLVSVEDTFYPTRKTMLCENKESCIRDIIKSFYLKDFEGTGMSDVEKLKKVNELMEQLPTRLSFYPFYQGKWNEDLMRECKVDELDFTTSYTGLTIKCHHELLLYDNTYYIKEGTSQGFFAPYDTKGTSQGFNAPYEATKEQWDEHSFRFLPYERRTSNS